jgi:hypothetical protein
MERKAGWREKEKLGRKGRLERKGGLGRKGRMESKGRHIEGKLYRL